MKRISLFSTLVLATMMAFVSCNKEIEVETEPANNSSNDIVTLTVNAGTPETKAVFQDKDGDSYPVKWSATGEAIRLAEVYTPGEGDPVVAAFPSTSYELTNSNATAKFSVSLTEKTAVGTYDYRVISPSTAYTGVYPSYSDVGIVIPGTQTPTATSPDPAAIVLYAGVTGLTAQPTTTLDLGFTHISAYGKMTIKNAGDAIGGGETIQSVSISVPAGGVNYYWSNGNTTSNNSTKTSEVIINTTNLNTSGDFTAWFACKPNSLAIGDILTVKVTTNVETYVRNIILTKALSFTSGQVSKFSVDMASATPSIYSTEFNYAAVGTNYANAEPYEGMDATGTAWYIKYGNWNGGNCGQLRVYSAGNFGNIQNGFDCSYVTSVFYDAKVSNTALKLNTYYSTDSGSSWTLVDENKALTTDFKRYGFVVSSTGAYAKVRVKFEVAGTKPASSYYALTIDNVEIYGKGAVILEPAITADNISGIAAAGGSFTNGTYAIHNFPGDVDDVSATKDNTVVTAASVDNNGHISYTVAPNYGSTARSGWITLSSDSGASKTITVGQAKSTLSVSSLIVTIPNNAETNTFTVSTEEFGWIVSATANDGKNLTIDNPTSGSATASATITVRSTTAATAAIQDLGTIKVYRAGTTAATDPQVKEITIRKASTAAVKYFRKVNSITSGKKYLIVAGGQGKALVPSTGSALKSSTTVTIDGDNKIESTSYTPYAVTITQNGTSYDITFVQDETTYYLIYNGSGTKLKTDTSASKQWDVFTTTTDDKALVGGSFRFKDHDATTRVLGYSSGGTFGGYAVSNFTGEPVSGSTYYDVDLYKLDD